MTALSYRLRIRNAADSADDLIITSIRGGTNPYLKGPPSGDGQELDVLMGSLRQGIYTAEIIDEITSGTDRVLTSKLFDANGQQQLLSRRAYIEISTDGGATWPTPGAIWPPTLVAGYVLNYVLSDAITWAVQVGDTRRIENNALVFDGTSTRFTSRGCLFGGPIFNGFGPVANRGGWTFRVNSVTTLSADYKLVAYAFVSGFRGSKDQRTTDLFKALGISNLPAQQAPVNVAAESLGRAQALPQTPTAPGIGLSGFPGSPGCFPGIQARIYTAAGSLLGRMTPAISLDGYNMITPYYSPTQFAVLWPTTITSPSVNDIHSIYAIGTAVSEVAPAYVDLHPVDYVTNIWDDLGVAYDATTTANIKAALGDTLRLALRITKSEKALDFLNRVIFGPFGIAARNNASGQRELIRTRLMNSANPTTTITTAMLRSQSEVIFQNAEDSVITSIRFKGETYSSYDDANSIDQQQRPLDGILVQPNEVVIQSGDVSTFGTKEVLYEYGGMIHDALSFGDQSAMLIEATGREIFNRFGRGAPDGEFRCLRFLGDGLWGDVNDDGVVDFADAQEILAYTVGQPVSNLAAMLARGDVTNSGGITVADAAAVAVYAGGGGTGGTRVGSACPSAVVVPNVGDEIYLEPAHLPNANKRFGDDPSVGARIVQIVRRTDEPAGPYYKVVDAGSDQQPISPAATISIAANADSPRSIAEFTITNAAAINAALHLIVAVEWATGGSSPAGGSPFTRFKQGACPTGAVQLPAVAPGSKVWVRARTEQDGRRASAWTAWTSVTLTAMTAPSALSFSNLRENAAQYNWTNANATDLIDVFVYEGGSAPADWSPYFVTTLKAGSTSITVRGLNGPSVGYVGAVMHRDPASGARSAAATGTFTTNSTLDTAPDMDGILVVAPVKDASLPVGIALALYPADQNFNIEIERAPDSSGSPGTYAALATIPGTQQIFVDHLPSDGHTYWYRARSSLSGYTPSAYTADVFGVPGGLSPSLKLGIAPPVPLVLSVTASVKPDGTGTISIQGNDLALSFKMAIGGSNPSDATVRAATPVAGPQVDVAFNSLSYPTGIYIGVFPYSAAAGAGKEGPRHNLFVNTLSMSVPQGTVLVDANGNWEASLNVPLGVSQANSVMWATSTSAFPSRFTVIGSGNFVSPTADGIVTITGGGLTLGDKIYISIICFAGSGYGTELPIIHLMGSYQSFSATKTYTWSPTQFVQTAVGGSTNSGALNYFQCDTVSGELGAQVNQDAANTVARPPSVFFGLSALFPDGVTITAFGARFYRNTTGTVRTSVSLYKGTTSVASLGTPSNSGTWTDMTPASLTESTTGNVYRIKVEIGALTNPDYTSDFANQALGPVYVTFSMPTPKQGL